jgi:hypothetical protein
MPSKQSEVKIWQVLIEYDVLRGFFFGFGCPSFDAEPISPSAPALPTGVAVQGARKGG